MTSGISNCSVLIKVKFGVAGMARRGEGVSRELPRDQVCSGCLRDFTQFLISIGGSSNSSLKAFLRDIKTLTGRVLFNVLMICLAANLEFNLSRITEVDGSYSLFPKLVESKKEQMSAGLGFAIYFFTDFIP